MDSQLFFRSYSNQLFPCYICEKSPLDFVPPAGISCTSRDRESNKDKLWRTTALIHVDNSRFAITAINSKLELKSTIKTNSFTLTIGCSMIFEIVANLVS